MHTISLAADMGAVAAALSCLIRITSARLAVGQVWEAVLFGSTTLVGARCCGHKAEEHSFYKCTPRDCSADAKWHVPSVLSPVAVMRPKMSLSCLQFPVLKEEW